VRPVCRRLLSDAAFRPARWSGLWRAAVLENARQGASGLRLRLSLERQPARDEPVVRQVWPGEVWLEAGPAGRDAAAVAQRWQSVPFSAPAFDLTVPGWPAQPGTGALVPPVVRVWWGTRPASPAHELKPGTDFRLDADRPVGLRAGEVPLTLEGVRVERRMVRVREDDPPEPRWCLAVRLSHPPGQPFWVRPAGLPPAGEEHRFYQRAGEYVGLFWFAGRDTEEAVRGLAAGSLRGLQLFSVAGFKKEAEHKAEFTDLSAPAGRAGGR
jgi:hypothetical protein